MKRVTSIILAISLFMAIMPAANAGRIDDKITLNDYAYLEIGGKFQYYGEFTNWNEVHITMAPGERLVTPPFHAFSTSELSLAGTSAVSSNQNVAVGKVVMAGQSPVNGKADTFMGLSISANSPGTATITVDYDTLTRGDLNDRRGTTHQTKTFIVTVGDGCLDIDMAFSAGEAVIDWPKDAVQDLRENQKQIEELSQWLSENPMPGKGDLALTASMEAGKIMFSLGTSKILSVVSHFSNRSNLIARFQKAGQKNTADLISKRTNQELLGTKKPIKSAVESPKALCKAVINWIPVVGDICGFYDAVQSKSDEIMQAYDDLDEVLSEAIRKTEEISSRLQPAVDPSPVELTVRIRNTGTAEAQSITLDLRSENVYFSSANGTGIDSRRITIPSIAAGETFTKTFKVYPRIVPNRAGTYGTLENVYTGVVVAECTYTDTVINSVCSADASATLPVYSKLTQQQIESCETVTAAFERDSRYVVAQCPVSMTIKDQEGNVLAVLEKDGDIFWDGFAFACVQDDAKLLSIPSDFLTYYQVELTATDDGEMDVRGMEMTDGINWAGYGQVALQKGDVFTLDLTEREAVRLDRRGADGTVTEELMTELMNEYVLAEMLNETDVTEQNRQAVAHAMADGFFPEEAPDSFQSGLSTECLSSLLVSLYEHGCGFIPGELQRAYEEAVPSESAEVNIVDMARWARLLPDDKEAADPQNLTAEYVNEAIACTFAQLEWDMWNGLLLPSGETVTVENAILTFKNLWDYGKTLPARNEYAAEFMAEYLGNMAEEEDFYGNPIWVLENNAETTPFKTTAVRDQNYSFVSLGQDAMSQFLPMEDLTSFTQQELENIQESPFGHMYNTKALVNMQRNGYTLTEATSLGGSFTDKNGDTYVWAPLYYTNWQKTVADHAIYLVILRYHTTEIGSFVCDKLILADQQKVREFLQTTMSLRESCIAESFRDLKVNDEGDDVMRLQEALIASRNLWGEATGVFDWGTSSAVRQFQQKAGIQQTGEADAVTQLMLYGYLDQDAIQIYNELR